MKIDDVCSILKSNPVIAAIHDENYEKVLNSNVKIIFCLKSNINTINNVIKTLHQNGKYVFIHMDLIEGIAKDKAGLKYLANLNVDGIISTRSQLITYAKKLNLLTVQRFFALDSRGVESITDMINLANPDFIEILPGVIPKIIKKFSSGNIPLITGGLISSLDEINMALSNGAIAVSTGHYNLYNI